MAEKLQIFMRRPEIYFYAARDRRYYERSGISVGLHTGKDSWTNGHLVASNPDSFGIIDGAQLLLCREAGLPIKALAIMASDTLAIVSLSKSRIRVPKDLEGKTLGLAKGGGEMAALPLLAAKSGLDLKKVRILDFAPGLGNRALLEGKVDAYAGYYDGSIQDFVFAARQASQQVSVIRYADYGINLYNPALVGNEQFLRSKPVTAKRFVTQTLKAFAWAIDNRDSAVSIYLDHHPGENRALALARFSALAEEALSEEARGNGLGWMSEQGWSRLHEMVLRYGALKKRLRVSDVYTIEFLEPGIVPNRAKPGQRL